MPVQKGKSGLAAKLGPKLKTAHDAHKDDELSLQGGSNLPDGIDNGIAQLVMMKFDQYKSGDNQGEFYFMAQGIVLLPKSVNGIPVAGERTKIGPEPVCDTPKASGKRKTLADHWGWVLNEIRKFGVNTAELSEEAILEAVPKLLLEQKPHFKFRTWKGEPTEQYPTPRVNEDWRGVCEFNPDIEDQVDDQTGAVEETEADEPVPDDDAVVAAENNGDATDYDALAELADGGDGDAARQIEEACVSSGISTDETAPLENWVAVVALLKERSGANGHATAEEVIPKAKEIHYYKPPKARKAVECEVTAVFEKSKTVNLKNLDDGRSMYKSVKWEELQETS